mmetsp:Transcript_19919/g.35845  ORF Transcript_19919/g.35845 Transcript_19919/m.35845 type:complete len:130 (-) Transcript_19919:1332-1721(-)
MNINCTLCALNFPSLHNCHIEGQSSLTLVTTKLDYQTLPNHSSKSVYKPKTKPNLFSSSPPPSFHIFHHKEPRCNIELPYSSYSLLPTHIFLNVAKLAKMLPPTQALSFLSGGAEIRILVLSGALDLAS